MKNFILLFCLFGLAACKKKADADQPIEIDQRSVVYEQTDAAVTGIEFSSGEGSLTAITDRSSITYWRSAQHDSPDAMEWISYTFSESKQINYVKLLPVYSKGKAINFPVKFGIYSLDGDGWKLLNSYERFPVSAGDWLVLPLTKKISTKAIRIMGTRLGGAGGKALSFQLAEATAGYDEGFNHLTFIENNSLSKRNEIRNIGSGSFDPTKMSNWHYDVRNPIITANPGGNSNIYAPNVIENGEGWNVYFGGWDGSIDGHDRISLTTTMDDFLSFSSHQVMIDNGDMIHVNNEAVIRRPDGKWHMLYTTLALDPQINKPGYAVSVDGINWEPAVADTAHLVKMDKYSNWDIADVNGSNVPFYENGTYHFYFNDFNFANNGHAFAVHHAISTDLIHFNYTNDVLQEELVAQDVKRFDVGGTPWYLMVLHINGKELRYSLGSGPTDFAPSQQLLTNQNGADRYIVSAGWIAKNNRLYGVLYGAGAVPSLDRNAINAKWLQKEVIFIDDATQQQLGRQAKAHGPDKLILDLKKDMYTGKFYVYDTDGSTLLFTSPKVTIRAGDVWNYTP